MSLRDKQGQTAYDCAPEEIKEYLRSYQLKKKNGTR
jgi:hypothetical protein